MNEQLLRKYLTPKGGGGAARKISISTELRSHGLFRVTGIAELRSSRMKFAGEIRKRNDMSHQQNSKRW